MHVHTLILDIEKKRGRRRGQKDDARLLGRASFSTWDRVSKSTDLSCIVGKVKGMKLNNFYHVQIKGYKIQALIN